MIYKLEEKWNIIFFNILINMLVLWGKNKFNNFFFIRYFIFIIMKLYGRGIYKVDLRSY